MPVVTLLPSGADAIFTGIDTGDRAGAAVRVGDLDGDSRRDIIIAAPDGDGPSNSRPNGGEIYVLWGSSTLASRSLTLADVTIYGVSPFLQTGAELTSGDVNRDNPDDLVILAAGGSNDAGELHFYYGRARSLMGTSVGNGRRVVDLAQAGQIDRRIFGAASLGTMKSVIVFEVTGEGARDVLVGIPSSENSTGAVFFTISPKMRISPDSVTYTMPEGGTRTSNITVTNASTIGITWAATSNVPWAGATPDTGSAVATSPGSFNLGVAGGALGTGTHTGRISVRSTSRDLDMAISVNITLNVTESRYMAMTAPAAGSTVNVPFVVRGWAIDTGVATGTGVQAVDIYAVPSGGGTGFLLGRATYGLSRPDVGSAHGARFANSGFEYQVTTLGSGSFRIEARATTTGGGPAWTKVGGGVTLTVQGLPDQNDFSGDSKMDLLWQHADGRIAGWKMNGTAMTDGLNITPSTVDPAWQLVATADLNGDHKPDLLWQHRDGWLAAWLMNGASILDGAMLNPSRVDDAAWKIAGTADLNGDGMEDIIWQHSTQGLLAAWLMNGTNILDGQLMNPNRLEDPAWKIAGTGDLNGDGKADLVFQHQTNGLLAVWYMNGANLVDGRLLPNSEPDTRWRLAALGDLNGDSRLDFVWQHKDGRLRAWLMNNAERLESVALTPGQVDTAWRLAGPR